MKMRTMRMLFRTRMIACLQAASTALLLLGPRPLYWKTLPWISTLTLATMMSPCFWLWIFTRPASGKRSSSCLLMLLLT